MTFLDCMAVLRESLPNSEIDLPTEPVFRDVNFGDPRFDEPYVRSNRGEFDTDQSRIEAQTDFVEAALELPEGSTILDAGCGIGTYSHELARRGHRVVGLDISKTFLQMARATVDPSDARFIGGSYRCMPFQGGFDAVVQTASMFCSGASDLARISLQAKACLRSGGKFLFDYSNWPLRCRSEASVQTDWSEDLDSFVLRRSVVSLGDWTQQAEWYRVSPAESTVLRCRFSVQLLPPDLSISAVRSAGFRDVGLFAKWDFSGRPPDGELRSFNEDTDRGFVLVATA